MDCSSSCVLLQKLYCIVNTNMIHTVHVLDLCDVHNENRFKSIALGIIHINSTSLIVRFCFAIRRL